MTTRTFYVTAGAREYIDVAVGETTGEGLDGTSVEFAVAPIFQAPPVSEDAWAAAATLTIADDEASAVARYLVDETTPLGYQKLWMRLTGPFESVVRSVGILEVL